ncbi:MAG: phosphotransferase [Clostridia bacterium]|nr:phosphotransferase [Clostridia bacterium]
MMNTNAFAEYVHSADFLSALGLEPNTELNFSLLGQGEYNANYVFLHPHTGRKLVLRINTGSQMHLDDQIEYEFFALKDLEASGRTPKPLFYDASKTILPYGTLVMEWLPGRPLDYHRDLDAAAQIFSDIHSLKVPAHSRLLKPAHPAAAIYKECIAMVEHYLTWDQAEGSVCRLLETLVREIGKMPLSEPSSAVPCMVNTEVNSGNFLINEGGRSYLVDWEKPLISEPAQDLAHFLVPTTTFWKTDVILSLDQIRHFVQEYRSAVGERMDLSSLAERLPLFFTVTCLRGVTWCAMAMREYSEPGRLLSNADTFAKIKEYLREDFLENLLDHYVRQNFLKGGSDA